MIRFCSILSRFPNPFLKGIRRVKNCGKTLYVTFDDGPTPGNTEQILHILNRYSVKATFFCCGKNADDNPELLKQIQDYGHSVGYHSYSHHDILKTASSEWLADVEKESIISSLRLFRPPYGRIGFSHYRKLKRKYDFVFWDVMSYDYRQDLSPEDVMKILDKSVRAGSVIVFHDNKKSATNTLKVLPLFIEKYLGDGYSFDSL